MEPKRSISIGLVIRRIIAGFIFLSTFSGVVAALETNSFNDEVIPSVFVSLLIIYYLARSPKKIITTGDVNYESTEFEKLENEVDVEEMIEEYGISLENVETKEDTISKTHKVNKSNPVRDNQGIFSRIFQGTTDRY